MASRLRDTAAPLLLCFDYEGDWGMPFPAAYDLDESTQQILGVLRRHDARAVFFVVGEIAVTQPHLIEAIARDGHEVAVHGWRHEALQHLSQSQLDVVGDGLVKSNAAIENVTGCRPSGFRAPYLLGPQFYNAEVYALLANLGYTWTSDREIRHVVELFRPDRLRTNRAWTFVRSHESVLRGSLAKLALTLLNARLLIVDGVERTTVGALRWLLNNPQPFIRHGMLEIPLYSPLDCDVLGFPQPLENTPGNLLEYAYFALREQLLSGWPVAMLTFHDWIVTGGNRLVLLDRLLAAACEEGLQTATVSELLDEESDQQIAKWRDSNSGAGARDA